MIFTKHLEFLLSFPQPEQGSFQTFPRDSVPRCWSDMAAGQTSSTYSFSSAPKAVTRKKYREPGDVEPGLYRNVPCLGSEMAVQHGPAEIVEMWHYKIICGYIYIYGVTHNSFIRLFILKNILWHDMHIVFIFWMQSKGHLRLSRLGMTCCMSVECSQVKETCISWDKRVHRGNTYSMYTQNAIKEAWWSGGISCFPLKTVLGILAKACTSQHPQSHATQK